MSSDPATVGQMMSADNTQETHLVKIFLSSDSITGCFVLSQDYTCPHLTIQIMYSFIYKLLHITHNLSFH